MIRRLESIVGVIAATMLFALMVITFVDVIGRNFFNRPLTGATELTEVVLALMIFMLLPGIAFRREHIVVDLIDPISNDAMRFFQTALTVVLGGALFALIGYRLWLLGDRAAGYSDATPSLGIPLAPVIYAMSILAFATTIYFLALLRRPTRIPGSPELDAATRLVDSIEEVTAAQDPARRDPDRPER